MVVGQGLAMLADIRLSLLLETGGSEVLPNITLKAATLLARFFLYVLHIALIAVLPPHFIVAALHCGVDGIEVERCSGTIVLPWAATADHTLTTGNEEAGVVNGHC